jgi:hypothetical protein
MQNGTDADRAYELAYEEAVRALSQQQSVIDSFRTRAGLVLSAAAITTSFLGAQALRAGGPNAATWIALGSFFLVGVAALAILWPRSWEFTANAGHVIAYYIEGDEPLELWQIHRDVALHMQDSYGNNQAGLERLIVYFRVAVALLTVEVIAWVIDLASKT